MRTLAVKPQILEASKRLQWQEFIDSQLLSGGACSEACILSAGTGKLLSHSPDFMPREYMLELDQSAEKINESKSIVDLPQKSHHGLRINGLKYTILRIAYDPVTIFARGQQGGVCITKTAKCIVVGTYKSTAEWGEENCNMKVEKLGRHFRKLNF